MERKYTHRCPCNLLRKKGAFERRVGTTQWPSAKHTGSNVAQRDEKEDPHNRHQPVNEPAFNLTGTPYIKETAVGA